MIIAAVTASVAESKGYDPGVAFIWGCIFNVWTLGYYLIMPNKKAETKDAKTHKNSTSGVTHHGALGPSDYGQRDESDSTYHRRFDGNASDREAIHAFGEGPVKDYYDLDDGANMGMDSFEYLSWKDSCDDDPD